MNDEVRLDPDHLRNRGERLAELGDRVGQTYAGLRDSLAHAEGSWGDDDLGVALAEVVLRGNEAGIQAKTLHLVLVASRAG